MAAGSLTLGGNMSLAVGPLGRNGEASGALSTKGKLAAMFVHYITLISNSKYSSHLLSGTATRRRAAFSVVSRSRAP
jgi:lipid-binding SYLF domain-containing protein